MGLKKLNYYDVEEVLVCPYCGDGPKGDERGCCGESSAHFETVYWHENGETYKQDEVVLVRPIKDYIRYELLSKYLWKQRIKRYKQRLKQYFRRVYDGTYPEKSFIRVLREKTGFRWSTLDCMILRQLHDFPLYYEKPSVK